MIEYPQTNRRVESDMGLYDAIANREIRHFDHPQLNEHIVTAVAIETGRGFRLAKGNSSKKIDAAVALAMALHGARDQPQGNVGQLIRKHFLRRSRLSDPDPEAIMKKFDQFNQDILGDF